MSIVGNAIKLNGVDQYVDINTPITLNGSSTIAWWEYHNSNTGTQAVFSSTSGDFFVWQNITGSTAILRLNNIETTGALTSGTISEGWHHWILSIAGTQTELYRDLSLDATFLEPDANDPCQIDYIGKKNDNTAYTDSIFSDFVIFDSALNTGERDRVRNFQYPDKTIKEIAWYKLNDVQNTIIDYSNNNTNPATLINATSDSYFSGVVPIQFHDKAIVKDYIASLTTNSSSDTITGLVHSSGDLLLAQIFIQDSTSVSNPNQIVTPPSIDWYRINEGRSLNERIAAFAWLADSTGNYTFDWSTDGPFDNCFTSIVAITNVPQYTGIADLLDQSDTNGDTEPVTAHTRDNMMIHFSADFDNAGNAFTSGVPFNPLFSVDSADNNLSVSANWRNYNMTGAAIVNIAGYEYQPTYSIPGVNTPPLAGPGTISSCSLISGAINLNGTDQYFVPSSRITLVADETIAWWQYWNGGAGVYTLLSENPAGSDYFSINTDGVSATTGILKHNAITQSDSFVTGVMPTGWHHWNLERQGGTFRVYIDGEQQADFSVSSADYEIDFIGCDNGSGNFWPAIIGDFRIYSDDLSDPQRFELADNAHMPNKTLTHWYKMDQGVSGIENFAINSTYDNPLTLINATESAFYAGDDIPYQYTISPLIRDNTVAALSGSLNSLTVSVPSNVSGDLLIAYIAADSDVDNDTSSGIITSGNMPVGWTQFDIGASGTSFASWVLAWKISNGAEPADYEWGFNTPAEMAVGTIVSISGAGSPENDPLLTDFDSATNDMTHTMSYADELNYTHYQDGLLLNFDLTYHDDTSFAYTDVIGQVLASGSGYNPEMSLVSNVLYYEANLTNNTINTDTFNDWQRVSVSVPGCNVFAAPPVVEPLSGVCYPLNESAGTNTASTPTGYDGTLVNFDVPADWTTGYSGNALEFPRVILNDPDRRYIDIPTEVIEGTINWSFLAWVKHESFSQLGFEVNSQRSLMSAEDLAFTNTTLDVNHGIGTAPSGRFSILTQGTGTVSAQWDVEPFETGVWTHLAVGVDAENGSTELWRDGESQGTKSFNAQTGVIETDFFILGNRTERLTFNTNGQLQATLDEVCIRRYAITQSDIDLLFPPSSGNFHGIWFNVLI